MSPNRACALRISVYFLLASLSAFNLFAQDHSLPQYVDLPGQKIFDFKNEPLRFIENERVKVGFDLSIGGAVVYLEDKATNSGNMINSCDWGRQIQLSYYSGPQPYIGPNGEKPSPHWAGLGWNPIQSGDSGGYGSRVLDFSVNSSGTKAFVRTRPMLWPHSGVPAECIFECRYRLIENGFELTATIINNRSDKNNYGSRDQETPALYTNAPWHKLVSYLGDEPFENRPLSTLVDKGDGKGWPWIGYYSPERWSALVDDNNYGVGVYQPNALRATAGFFGGDDAKGRPLGPKDGATGYIAPLETTILDWNIKRSYRATFIVGSLEEIRKTVYRLAKRDVAQTPKWNFKNDRCNWMYVNGVDEGLPIVDALKIHLSEQGVVARSPLTFWKAKRAKFLEIDAAFERDDSNTPEDSELKIVLYPVSPADCVDYLCWSEGAKDAAKERAEKDAYFPQLPPIETSTNVKLDGERRLVRIDLTTLERYQGAMKQLEIHLPKQNGKATLYRVALLNN